MRPIFLASKALLRKKRKEAELRAHPKTQRKEKRMKRNRRREFVYNPPPAPDERFFEQMDELLKVSGRLAAAAKILGDKGSEALAKQLREEATKIRMLRRNLEEKYLSGERSDHKWQ